MSGSGATYPAEGHSKVNDAWLAAKQGDENAVYYCEYKDGLDPKHTSTAIGLAKMPRGIIINRHVTDTDAIEAVVRGYLHDERAVDTDDWPMAFNTVYPLRFKRIYANGTTARGIRILY